MALRPITDFASQILKPYINNQDKAYAANIAPVETSPATSAHTAGTQIIYNGVLYDVTADINANDALATTGAGANIAAADDVSEQISNVKQALSNEVTTRSKVSTHNLLRTRDDNDTWRGVTFTKNSDKTFTISGQITTSPSIWACADITGAELELLKGAPLIISGSISNTSRMNIAAKDASGTYVLDENVYTDEKTITIPNSAVELWVYFVVYETVSGTYKPMLRWATDSNSEYSPYVPTNSQLLSADLNAKLGAHNFLNHPSGVQTHNGVTYTPQSDFSILVNGTADGSSYYNDASLKTQNLEGYYFTLKAGTYVLSSGFDALPAEIAYVYIAKASNDSTFAYIASGQGEKIFTVSEETKFVLRIQISTGVTVSNVTVKPLIKLPSDPSNAITPYAMTNKELTDEKANISDMVSIKVTGDTNNSGVVIPIGWIFSFNGELVKAKTAIGVNAALTLNTNYEKFANGVLNGLSLFATTDIGTTALKTYADSYSSGGRIEWVSYDASNADAPSAYAGYAQIISMTSNFRTIIAYSRDGKMYQLCKSTTWGTWKTITMT